MTFQEAKLRLSAWQNKTNPIYKEGDLFISFNVIGSQFYKLTIIVITMFGFSEILSLSLICLILKTLKRNSRVFSRQTYKLYFQLTLLLAAQLASPLICVFIPVIICLIAVLNRIEANNLIVQMGLLGIVLYGLLNSLLTIIFISAYRRHFLDVFIFPWLKPLLRLKNRSTPVQELQTPVFTRNEGV
jgi:hypothetical protein